MTGRWGWRPLVMSLFISVFVVACNVVNSPTATPTASAIPPVTLTLRQPRGPTTSPSPNSAPSTPRSTDPAPAVASVDTSLALPSLMPLVIESPVCYPNGTQTTLCLGLARNPSRQLVERVVVQVRLSSADGPAITVMSAIEQAVILPNGYAPYRAVFNGAWQAEREASATLVQAQLVTHTEAFTQVRIESEQAERIGRQYRVSAVVYNLGPHVATQIRAVLTLLRQDGSVAGYRVTGVGERLAAGERLPIQVELVPQQDDEGLSHLLYIEARREDDGD